MLPFQTREITNEREYFGRDQTIKDLITYANMGLNKEIIGLRRSGKTSLLKIIETKLRDAPESTVYPIFFDFKSTASYFEKGTHLAYKYMIARLIARLYDDIIHVDDYTIRGITIRPTSHWEDIFACIEEVSPPKTNGIFNELIELCAQKTNKSVLFLIDEFEYLFKERFDKPDGFYDMRTLGNKTASNGKKIFSFWIAGAMDWIEMCTSTGSPPLNTIDSPTIYLGSLDRKSFHEMWIYETDFIQDNEKKPFLVGCEEKIFELTGGFPYFGKQIGSYLLNSGREPNNNFFDSYFKDLQKILNEAEKQCLGKLAINSEHRNISERLKNTGLVRKQEHNYEISIPFLKIFLNSTNNLIEKGPYPEAYEMAVRAEEYIIQINKNCLNYQKKLIFEIVPETMEIWKDIKTTCTSDDKFKDFSTSLYKLIYETTKDIDPNDNKEKSMQRFPEKFRRNNSDFISIVDIMRHIRGKAHIQSQLKTPKWKITYPDALQMLLGDKKEPVSVDDFTKLQIEILKLFEKAMQSLHQIVMNELNPNKGH